MRLKSAIVLFVLLSSQVFSNSYSLEDVKKMIVGKWKFENFYKGKLKNIVIREYLSEGKVLIDITKFEKNGKEKNRNNFEMKYIIKEAVKKIEINQFILATQVGNEIHLMDICFDTPDKYSELYLQGKKIIGKTEYIRMQEKQTSSSKEIKIGMTEDEVIKCFGEPEKKIDFGSKKIFKYADMKITFENGKVVDAEFD